MAFLSVCCVKMCEVVVEDIRISSKHCRIYCEAVSGHLGGTEASQAGIVLLSVMLLLVGVDVSPLALRVCTCMLGCTPWVLLLRLFVGCCRCVRIRVGLASVPISLPVLPWQFSSLASFLSSPLPVVTLLSRF